METGDPIENIQDDLTGDQEAVHIPDQATHIKRIFIKVKKQDGQWFFVRGREREVEKLWIVGLNGFHTVAVVSNNNSATANVMEKLREYGLDFIAAFLGNRENRKVFFAEQSGTYPDMSHWHIEEPTYNSIKQNLIQAQNKLNVMLE